VHKEDYIMVEEIIMKDNINLVSSKLTDSEVVLGVKKEIMIKELNEKKLVELGALESKYEADRSSVIKKYEDYEATL
jgi:hypothetical protein